MFTARYGLIPYIKQVSFFRYGITKCSNEVYDKFTDIRQHDKYLLEYLGYMFRPVNRSSSGHEYSGLIEESLRLLYCYLIFYTIYYLYCEGLVV